MHSAARRKAFLRRLEKVVYATVPDTHGTLHSATTVYAIYYFTTVRTTVPVLQYALPAT